MMSNQQKIVLSFNTVFIEDTKGHGYSGYLAEFPELMAQGKTKEEVESKLFSSLRDILEHKKNQSLFNQTPSDYSAIETINLIPA
jgi:predicted RNase H-like HicB family nuclease